MKGRALILIFLFLILLPVTSATDIGIGTFAVSGTDGKNFDVGYTLSGHEGVTNILFNDASAVNYISSITCKFNSSYWQYGNTSENAWWDVTYKVGATTVGTGTFGWNKAGDGYHYVTAFFNEDFSMTGYSGETYVTIDGIYVAVGHQEIEMSHWGDLPADADAVGFHWKEGHVMPGNYQFNYRYITTNEYTYGQDNSKNYLNVLRTGATASQYLITTVDREVVNETTSGTSDTSFYDYNFTNTAWTVLFSDPSGHSRTYNLVFPAGSVDTSGIIDFNQTFYTDPENIEVGWDIDNYDNVSFIYEIQIVTSVSGDPSQDSWAADGNWNTSPFISSASGAAVFDFYSDGYDLPIWIQAELWAQDKNTGTWTRLDSSPVERYHEKSDFGVGSIWTEKSTYNLSEMFYIFVETDYSIIDIELISDTYHDRQTLEVFEGGWQRVGYAFFSPHNFTAYLYEDGVITNQTSFSVWTTSPMMNIFLDSEALKTQFAFEFYTDNSSDTITGYKPDGSIFYGPTTDLETGSREIIRGVSSSSPPGIYTISLFHDGTTYYNDTIELYSTSEWVYFDASKYETGDRIKIYSFVTDSRQQVRLTDSIGTAVITWTDSAGYIVPNSQTVLYFSLTDNNEYGMNVNTSIDAGTFRTGNWKVEIIGIDGKPLTNESTYDYTTVSKRIESPADSSNEMISIFFSPEGAFLLFTVALTMMGLVASKHPAGGGAGAVVGVGFGVYFNVLPAWMLMLMVIALVVLAGVTIAVHFKGK